LVLRAVDQQADQPLVALGDVQQRQLGRQVRSETCRLLGERRVIIIVAVVVAAVAVAVRRTVFKVE